jgi:uncharacterized protein
MTYPAFIEIDGDHKDIVNNVTSAFPPYCDFQFSNLFSWSSTKHPTKISLINGNLLAEMKEYDTDRIITMFMGRNDVVKSICEILKTRPILERVPEDVVRILLDSQLKDLFYIVEDTGNHDYVVRLEDIVGLKGREYKSKRKSVRGFERLYGEHQVREIDPSDANAISLLRGVFEEVSRERGVGFEVLSDEFEAVNKLLVHAALYDIDILTVFYRDRLIGFTINEILHESPYKTALGCFGKSLRRFKGLFSYMEFITANYLLKKGIEHINLEEDMGFSGLEASKRLWRPDKMLRKYVVKLRC